LNESNKDRFAFEGLLSEATGDALTEDSVHTLACFRATKQLSQLFGCENDWAAVVEKRKTMDYQTLCDLSMKKTGIQCILLDDGLDSEGVTESYDWHDRFTPAKSKRIVRIEWLAQVFSSDSRHGVSMLTYRFFIFPASLTELVERTGEPKRRPITRSCECLVVKIFDGL
jgi:hypothetical protein